MTTSRRIYLSLGFLGMVAAAAVLAAVTALTTPRTVFLLFLFLISTALLFVLLGLLIYKAWQAFCWVIRWIATRCRAVLFRPVQLPDRIRIQSHLRLYPAGRR